MRQALFLFALLYALSSACLAQTDTAIPAVAAIDSGAADKVLHISTNPSYADAFVGKIRPDFAGNPDCSLPGFLRVPAGEASVLVSIFKPGFKDTTINVTLAETDSSYLIVSLEPSYDNEFLDEQQKTLSHRSRRNFGHRLLVASAIPLVASGIGSIVAHYNIGKAEDKKDIIEESVLRQGEAYEKNLERYDDYRDKAKSARNFTIGTLIAGGIILGVGVVLSF